MPEDIKGELPTIEEIEQELDKELQGRLNPIDARLKVIREKLKGIESEEMQTQVSYPVLMNLFENSLKPLYQEIIESLSAFDDNFHSKMFTWSSNNKSFSNLRELEEFWKQEVELRNVHKIPFSYNLYGFRKAGTESYDEYLQLNFEIHNYWYGFSFNNYNNQQPFLKKLYHQPLTKGNRDEIIALLMNKIMDRIEWIIEAIEKKDKSKKG